MSSPARKYTNKLLDMLYDGSLDKDWVILCCLKYMSENDVEDMMRSNELLEIDEDEVISDD